jgi:hypothetical protein
MLKTATWVSYNSMKRINQAVSMHGITSPPPLPPPPGHFAGDYFVAVFFEGLAQANEDDATGSSSDRAYLLQNQLHHS